MANEARVTSGLQVRKTTTGGTVVMDYLARPNSFTATVSGTLGPTPGAIVVSGSGTDVVLSQLTTPGLCRMMNMDSTNYVSVGVYEPNTGIYYPFMELLPGESYVFRLSRFYPEEQTGTGTLSGATNATLRLKAHAASGVTTPVSCTVLVEAFEA